MGKYPPVFLVSSQEFLLEKYFFVDFYPRFIPILSRFSIVFLFPAFDNVVFFQRITSNLSCGENLAR
jgi:hypothetical protein